MISKKRITIEDVAQKAGVSKQTVSRVINNKPDVAPQTRKHIQALIEAMGYTPDPIARSMKGTTQTLGCIVPNLSDYNFSAIVQAAQEEARKQGYFILIGSAESEFDVPPLLNELVDRRVDGLLVVNPRDDNRYRHFLPLIDAGMPVVYIKNNPINEPVSAVSLDDETGGFFATQHLISLGHTLIVTILGRENEECTQKRFAGFQKALRQGNIEEDQRLIVSGDWSAKSGQAAVSKLLGYQAQFSAIFAQNDWMAIGAMRALREVGLKIPQDVSVIGYDDQPMAAFLDPPLTTIRQPIEAFGRSAAKLIIEAIHQPDLRPKVIELEPSLVIRETCAPLHNPRARTI